MRLGRRRRDKFNVYKHSLCNLCFKSIPPHGSKGKRAQACQKVNNNNQQITGIKRVITARDNEGKKKRCALSPTCSRKGVWGRMCYNQVKTCYIWLKWHKKLARWMYNTVQARRDEVKETMREHSTANIYTLVWRPLLLQLSWITL